MNESVRDFAEVLGSFREFLGVFGSFWEFLGVFGSFWEFLGVFGSFRSLDSTILRIIRRRICFLNILLWSRVSKVTKHQFYLVLHRNHQVLRKIIAYHLFPVI